MSIWMIMIPLSHIVTKALVWKRSGYNDGRKKTLFCVAVNLLNLQDLKEVLGEIESKSDIETLTLKEKSTFAAGLLQEIGSHRKIELKLHRKK